jgi:hypothetical protein
MAAALAGLVALAAGVAGCGGNATARVVTFERTPAQTRAVDVVAINAALAADQRTIAGYVASGPLLARAAQHVDGWFLGQELSHAGVLRSIVSGLGGIAHQPNPAYPLGHPHTRAQLLRLLGELERGQMLATADAITRVHEGWIRARLAAMLADDAQHVAVLAVLAGQPPTTDTLPLSDATSIDLGDVRAFERLLGRETVMASVLAWSLRSGRLGPHARSLVVYMLGQHRAHIRELERLLAAAGYPQPVRGSFGRLTVGHLLSTVAVRPPPSALRQERGWIRLLEDAELGLEGLLYYETIPRLTARDALLAAAMLVREGQYSALLSVLRRRQPTPETVPAAMVRGWRLSNQPAW